MIYYYNYCIFFYKKGPFHNDTTRLVASLSKILSIKLQITKNNNIIMKQVSVAYTNFWATLYINKNKCLQRWSIIWVFLRSV